jgi:hypothetical protein
MAIEESDQLKQYPDSVLEKGFGVVGKIVMQDRRLSVTSKAIYSYICTFGNVAFPGRDKICYDLQINKGTYSKHLKDLVIYGYLSVKQQRSSQNMFQHNVYMVNSVPKPCIKKPYTEENQVETPCIKKPDTVEADTEKPCTVKADSNITTTLIKQVLNKTTTKTDVVVSTKIDEKLIQTIMELAELYGIPQSTIEKYIRQYNTQIVFEKLKLLKSTLQKTIIDNPAGWLRIALRDNFIDTANTYHLFKEKQKSIREKRVQHEAEKLNMTLQKELEEAVDPEGLFYKLHYKKDSQNV